MADNGITAWTREIEMEFLLSLAEGQTISEVCRRIGFARSTYYDRLETDEEWAGQITRARARGCEAHEEEIQEIADDSRNDYMERMTGDGEVQIVFNSENVQRSKLRIYAREKRLAWANPARYGTSRVDHTTGGNALPTTDAEAMATRMASILAEGEARRRAAEGEE